MNRGGQAMMNLAQSVLPFKIEATEERLTANAGLALFGEFIRGVGLGRWLATEMPQPGSARRKLHVPRPTSSITVKTRARPSPSGWAAKSGTPTGWCTRRAWTSRRTVRRRSAPGAGCVNATTARSAPSRRWAARWTSTNTAARCRPTWSRSPDGATHPAGHPP